MRFFTLVALYLVVGSVYCQEMKSYFNEKNQFTISYPRSWDRKIPGNINPIKFTTNFTPSGVVPTVSVSLAIRKTNDCTLDTIFYRSMKHLHVEHGERVLEGGEAIINKRTYYWFSTLAKNENFSVKRKHYLTIRDNKLISVTYSENFFEGETKYEEMFQKIISSLILH